MTTTFRRLLIRVGKMLPFVLCGLISISCLEMVFALIRNDYLSYGGVVILNTPISFVIGQIFELDWLVCFITLVISIAVEACKWNLWATFYLVFHLMEKSYFDFELDVWQICVIAIANLLVSAFFVYKGIRILAK